MRCAGRPTQGRAGAGYREVGDLVPTDDIMNDAFWGKVYLGLTGEMLEYMVGNVATACGRKAS